MNNKRLIKKERRDSIKIRDYSKIKKRLAIILAILGAIGYIVFLSVDIPKKEPEEKKSKIEQEEQKTQALTPVEGGRLRLSVSRFSSVDPYRNREKSMDDFFRLVYDSLFEYDENYNLVPELAESYTVGEDGKSITVRLKSNAAWHNGGKVTAEDVVFTIAHIKSQTQSPYYYLVKNISKATAQGQNVVLELATENSLEAHHLIFPIISSRSKGGTAILQDENFGLIGNGMFRVVEYNKGKNILLKRNDEYYGTKPYIREIMVNIYADSTIRKNMFTAKASDLIESNYYELKKYDYDVFRSGAYQSRQFDYIAFNAAKEPFSQRVNRMEIAKLIDIQTAVKDAYRDEIKLSLLPIHNESELLLVKNSLYDKEAIKNAKLTWATPRRLKIITDKTDPLRHRMAYVIKGQLALAGIDSDVIGLSKEEVTKAVQEANYDLGVFSYEAPLDKDITRLLSLQLHFPKDIEKTKELMASVYKQGNKTFQKQNYLLAQEELLKWMPYIGIGFRNDYMVYNQRVHGNLQSNSVELYNGIEKIFIKESLT